MRPVEGCKACVVPLLDLDNTQTDIPSGVGSCWLGLLGWACLHESAHQAANRTYTCFVFVRRPIRSLSTLSLLAEEEAR